MGRVRAVYCGIYSRVDGQIFADVSGEIFLSLVQGICSHMQHLRRVYITKYLKVRILFKILTKDFTLILSFILPMTCLHIKILLQNLFCNVDSLKY
jgi:hypothetical protein